METPEERTRNRRIRYLKIAGLVGGVVVIGGVLYVVKSPQAGETVAELVSKISGVMRRGGADGIANANISTQAAKAGEASGSQAADQLVRAHQKMQAHGEGWSQHRLILIDPYRRAAPAAA